MHEFSTCSVHFSAFSLCFIARPQYLFVCLFISIVFCGFFCCNSPPPPSPFSLKSKLFRRPSIPFPFHGDFQPDRSAAAATAAASSRFSRFVLLFCTLTAYSGFSMLLGLFWPFRLLFEFRFLLVFPALHRENCILPLLVRLALGQPGHQLWQIE